MKIYLGIIVFILLAFKSSFAVNENFETEKNPDIPTADKVIDPSEPVKEDSLKVSKDIQARDESDDIVFRMREFDTNYLIMGKPDTKVQFSFKFKFFKNAPVYLGYTQIMFWDLFRKESNPFSEINFNPELFYKFGKINSLIDNLDLGYSHLSNGEDEEESRSVDMIYLRLNTVGKSKYGIPNLQLIFRYLLNEDETNEDINEFYGPIAIRFYFDRLGQKLFQSEQFYLEYYNGGIVVNDYSRGSVRLSARFKVLASEAAPRIFIQYFNGYGENLANYNVREETYRMGLSIGGF